MSETEVACRLPEKPYIPWQPPMPHCGKPQPPPEGAGAHIGKLKLARLCAAGTLNRFSSFRLPQLGHSGTSPPRIKSSKSFSHFWQVYSYSGIGLRTLNRDRSFVGPLYDSKHRDAWPTTPTAYRCVDVAL
jgi:hypothetical protein